MDGQTPAVEPASRTFPVVGSLIIAIRHLFAVAVVSIIIGMLTSIGAMLLLVPGILVAVTFWVVVPPIVVERASIGRAFARSIELTRNRRQNSALPVSMFVMMLFQAPVAALSAVAMSVGYHELRVEKEGFGVEDLAAVFD